MVGQLIHFDEKETATRTLISPDNIFVEKGEFTASGIIENIAQTCAARIGSVNKYVMKKGIQLGFIGAIRNLKIYRHPKVNQVIETTVHTMEEVFGMTLVSAKMTCEGNVISECQMKIALSDVESQSQSV